MSHPSHHARTNPDKLAYRVAGSGNGFEAAPPRTPTGKLLKRHLRDRYWPKPLLPA